MEAEARFRAMGSDVHVVVVGGARSLLGTARELIEHLEQRWSRFRGDSEVSQLNAMAGSHVRVSPETLALVQRALEGARITGGRYDPTVLGDVIRAGYDRSFELLDERTTGGVSSFGRGFERVVVDPVVSTVTLPPGVGFDPGGIGKGYAADLVVQELLSRGAAGACVNMGGDLRVEGESPSGDAWIIGVEHPLKRRSAGTVAVRRGAAATTTKVRRTWGPAGDRRHHLIDPSTGAPVRNGVVSSTVIAAEGWQAEVLAKGTFVAGLAEGLVMFAETGTEGVLFDERGAVYPSYGFDRFARPELHTAGVR
ncbi:MAG TPA: hypothetical protein DIT48_13455 [Actinobacteria bacterium]|nr:hypothetical protein [Actinomycetota bacterium]